MSAMHAPIERMSLRIHALVHPQLELVDLLGRPRAVARHGSIFDVLIDGLGVLFDVVVVPEIKDPDHVVPVFWTEQGLDVGCV
jgi:hypothetical protein